eukprot:CAMPEP_0174261360 /NCGR_PEP_ID=MMETSP0439-20130205/11383_1 /TAXON_ID=0 /ORGANISM="Stereomyxa ramosa, Strain Chinc5" /LENGTH=537 /DNA_ID=CAMNT_0015345819 /DNA_START=63 /DNA_END=1676 /DNA_ORIENTATION=-
MGIPELLVVQGNDHTTDTLFDSVIVVSPAFPHPVLTSDFSFSEALEWICEVDKSVQSTGVHFHVVGKDVAAGGRLILAHTGPLDRDYDDVRRYAAAGQKAARTAVEVGSVSPLLVVVGRSKKDETASEYEKFVEVTLLGMLHELYQPLQAREAKGEEEMEPIKSITLLAVDREVEEAKETIRVVKSMEEGRRVMRDIGGADPERMSAPNIVQYLQSIFDPSSSSVSMSVLDDPDTLKDQYPCLHAVGRCSLAVPRHQMCVVHLEYVGEGDIQETLMFAGKGVVYDTGGADIKYGGTMSGMHMDKGGAAAVAGFFKTADLLKPKNIKLVCELGFVRNSSGADNYVSDEVITSHAGVRVLVGNTDAEGRMVMLECLSHLREQALNELNVRIMTCATLTGHAGRAVGPYAITLDNGPARQEKLSKKLQKAGHKWGDCFEVSTLRREDFDWVSPKNTKYDVLQCNSSGGSSGTKRGHQFPAALLLIASGLNNHGRDSSHPLCFSHLDIAGAACVGGDFQFGKPTATPIVALTARYLLDRLP